MTKNKWNRSISVILAAILGSWLLLSAGTTLAETTNGDSPPTLQQVILNHYTSQNLEYNWHRHDLEYFYGIISSSGQSLRTHKDFHDAPKPLRTSDKPMPNVFFDRSNLPIDEDHLRISVLKYAYSRSGIATDLSNYLKGSAASGHQLGFSQDTLLALRNFKNQLVEVREEKAGLFRLSEKAVKKRYDELIVNFMTRNRMATRKLAELVFSEILKYSHQYNTPDKVIAKMIFQGPPDYSTASGRSTEINAAATIKDGHFAISVDGEFRGHLGVSFFSNADFELLMALSFHQNVSILKDFLAMKMVPWLARLLIRLDTNVWYHLGDLPKYNEVLNRKNTEYRQGLSNYHLPALTAPTSAVTVTNSEEGRHLITKYDFTTISSIEAIRENLNSFEEHIQKVENEITNNHLSHIGTNLIRLQGYITDFTTALQAWSNRLPDKLEEIGLLNPEGTLQMSDDPQRIKKVADMSFQVEETHRLVIQMHDLSRRFYGLLKNVYQKKQSNPNIAISSPVNLPTETNGQTSSYLTEVKSFLEEGSEQETTSMIDYLSLHQENIMKSLVSASKTTSTLSGFLQANVVDLHRQISEANQQTAQNLQNLCRNIITPD